MGYPQALELARHTQSATADSWPWFSAVLENRYKRLLEQASDAGTATKKVREQCWYRVMWDLKIVFDELRKVRVRAVSAINHSDRAQRNGTFLHCTLHALWVMDEFRQAEIERHPAIQNGLLQFVFETYQPRDSTDLSPCVTALETLTASHTSSIGQHRADINRLNGGGARRNGGNGGGGG